MTTPVKHIMRKTSGEEGFTLLELLIAMTLLGLLMVLVFGGLRFGARVWERSEAHGTGTDQVRQVQALVRRKLEGAYPYYVQSNASRAHIAFVGEKHRLSFLAPISHSLADAGLSNVSLEVVSDAKGIRLVETEKWKLDQGDATSSKLQETLLDGLSSGGFSYFGSERPNEAPSWHDNWIDTLNLPLLVRVTVKFKDAGDRIWPELTIAPRISVDVACVYDHLTKKCQGR